MATVFTTIAALVPGDIVRMRLLGDPTIPFKRGYHDDKWEVVQKFEPRSLVAPDGYWLTLQPPGGGCHRFVKLPGEDQIERLPPVPDPRDQQPLFSSLWGPPVDMVDDATIGRDVSSPTVKMEKRSLTPDDFRVPPNPEMDRRFDILRASIEAEVSRDMQQRDLELVGMIRGPLTEMVTTLYNQPPQAPVPTPGEMLARLRALLRDLPPPDTTPYVLASLDVPFDDNTALRMPAAFLPYMLGLQRIRFMWADEEPTRDILLMNVPLAQIAHSVTPLRMVRMLSPRSALYEVSPFPLSTPLFPPFR